MAYSPRSGRRRLIGGAALALVAGVAVLHAAGPIGPGLPLPQGWVILGAGLTLLGLVAVTQAWTFPLPRRRRGEAAPAPRSETRPGAVRSIAVLPFVDMSELHDLEYFCDGIAEEITDALTHVPGLGVAARTSAFAYKGRGTDIRAVGRELGVDAVLEGSVRLAGERVRITAQLIDVTHGYHIWSEHYDRTRQDILVVQEDIARSVVERVSTTMPTTSSGGRVSCCVRSHSRDPEAFELYLKGRHYWRVRDQVGLGKGVDAFREAVERDPEYALPYAGLADAYATMAFYGLMNADEARRRSTPAIERALALEPRQPEVQHALATNRYWLHWDFAGAERAYREALELNPQHGESAAYLSQMLGVTGRPDQAVEWAERARDMEPLSPLVLAVASSGLHMAGLYTRSAEMASEALELDGTYLLGKFMLGLNLMGLGQEERAEEMFRGAVERSARNPFVVSLHAWALAEMGQTDEAWELAHEIEHRVGAGAACWCDLGGARAGLWDLDGALRDFETAVRSREVRVVYLRRALPYRMLSELPRFHEMCRAIGI